MARWNVVAMAAGLPAGVALGLMLCTAEAAPEDPQAGGSGGLSAAGLASGADSTNGWRLVFADDFNRSAMGPQWRPEYGDGRHVRLRENAIRISHSSTLRCTVPLPHGDVRVELQLGLPWVNHGTNCHHRDGAQVALRSGEMGVGGIYQRFGVELRGVTNAPTPRLTAKGVIELAAGQPHRLVLQIRDDTGYLSVDGHAMASRRVAPPASELTRYLAVSTLNIHYREDAILDDVRVLAGPRGEMNLPLTPNTPAQNRQATVEAARFMCASNPAAGIQQAIDTLPPGGGVVILPAGDFALRRHLRLRSNMTLCGQGAGLTVLRACHSPGARIVDIRTGEGQCEVTISATNAPRLQAGDGVGFGKWSHPGDDVWGHLGEHLLYNKDCVITAVDGLRLTIRGLPPPGEVKSLNHWFPLVYAHGDEFVEVEDLTLVGSRGLGWGGFEASCVTLGQTAGVRLQRVQIERWDGDGFSLQTAGDAILTDNTVSNTYQGYHPGTITQRFLWHRNLGMGNTSCGLYFCYVNRNGVYYQNTLDRFNGYAWPSDDFNLIAGNMCTGPFQIEQGRFGVIFNNRFSQLKMGHGQPGAPTRNFLVAQNSAAEGTLVPGLIQDNLLAGNRLADGAQPLFQSAFTSNNFVSSEGAKVDLSRFPLGVDRRGPEPPPVLPAPILDGREYYRPGEPDGGFQEALDRLAQTGGTLLLPGGRYPLARPLAVPGGVTLVGRGLGTVLLPARPDAPGSLIVAQDAVRIAIRDLVVLGEYAQEAFREPAIALRNVVESQVIAVDLRGWEGVGLSIAGGQVQVRECRALGCAGSGFEFGQCRIDGRANIARECAAGFRVNQTGPDSRLEANIAGNNRGDGYALSQVHRLLFTANNSSGNDGDGIRLLDTERAELIANSVANNAHAHTNGCAIRLDGATRGCTVVYNHCADDQPAATQAPAIVEAAPAGGNTLRFNLVVISRPAVNSGPGLVADGPGTMADMNLDVR